MKVKYMILIFSIFTSIKAEGHGRQPMTFLADKFWNNQNKSVMTNVAIVSQLPGITNLPGEKWKAVDGYNGKYYVSNKARVASHYVRATKSFEYRVANGSISSHGYRVFSLSKYGERKLINGKRSRGKSMYCHRLMGFAWVQGYQEGFCIDHKNGNKLDNRIENLEWVEIGENTRRAFNEQGLIKAKGENHNNSKLLESDVLQARIIVAKGGNAIDAIRIIGKCSQVAMQEAIRGETWGWLEPSLDTLIGIFNTPEHKAIKGEKWVEIKGAWRKTYATSEGRLFYYNDKGYLLESKGQAACVFSKFAAHRIDYIIFDAFNPDFKRNRWNVITYKDGNKLNRKIENLVMKTRTRRSQKIKN